VAVFCGRRDWGLAMRSVVVAAFALALSAGACLAAPEAKPTLLAGEVGASPIVMELDASGAGGRYFYRRTRYDIDLSGETKAGTVTLDAFATGDHFVLQASGQGYAGEMTTKAGKRLPVSLHRMPAGDSYPVERRSGLTLQPGKTETIDGRLVRWYIEPSTRISLFRLQGGYAYGVVKTINAALEAAQWRSVDDYYVCPGEGGGPGMEESRLSAVFLSADYVGWAWSSSWSCAVEAHPDFGTEGHTFSARTGRELGLDDLIAFGKAPPRDTDAWRSYRSSHFAAGLVARLKALHPKEMAKPGADDGCDYSDPGVWGFPSWYPTSQGLYVGAIFPRVARNCDNPKWSVIPWSRLGK
jgi:hypothetical protein